ncbi:hypothetical protein ACIBVL_40205 [Streptomyces sp. NPDC049687]|uniref:hypothetical protein n=1 Tax=Streptomyces sp. NPDC049687 TaxID=3365596 RepID=UPI003790DFC2
MEEIRGRSSASVNLRRSGIQPAREDAIHGMVTAVRAANPGQSLSRRNAHTTAMSPAAIHVEDHNAIGRQGQ